MDFDQLLAFLENIPQSVDDPNLVKVFYEDGFISFTYYHDELLVQKFMSCDTPQEMNPWTITVLASTLALAIYQVTFREKKKSKLHLPKKGKNMGDLIYLPEYPFPGLIVQGALGEIRLAHTTVLNWDGSIREPFPPLDFLEFHPLTTMAFPIKEWQWLKAAAHIAKKNVDPVGISFAYDDPDEKYVTAFAKSPSMIGLFNLSSLDTQQKPRQWGLGLDLIEYIQNLNPQPAHIEVELYLGRTIVLFPGTRVIAYQETYQHMGFDLLEGVSLAIAKEALVKAIASCAGKSSFEDPDCNQVTLEIEDKILTIHGKNGTRRLPVKYQSNERKGRIMLCSVSFLDLLDHFPVSVEMIELELPLIQNPQVLGLRSADGRASFLIGGVVKKPRSQAPTPKVKGVWDASDPHREVIHTQDLPDGKKLVLSLVEESAVEKHLSFKELEALKKESWDDDLPSDPPEEAYAAAVAEMQQVYREAGHIVSLANKVRRATPDQQELEERLRQVNQFLDYYAWQGTSEDLFHHGGLCPKDLAYETEEVRLYTQNIQLKAGRLLEVIKKLDKTYRVEFAVVDAT